MCRQQSEVYLRAQPLGAQAARNALEPLVNLARLRLRDGQADDAYQLLDTLFRAVKARSGDVIDGRLISFRNLTDSEQGHKDVVKWLWSVLLADGTRALAGAGRWPEALSHVQQHKGIGRRLLTAARSPSSPACPPSPRPRCSYSASPHRTRNGRRPSQRA